MHRPAAVALAVLALAACSDVDPVGGPQMGANEMHQKAGLFSGPEGDFVLVGPDNWNDPPELEPKG